MANHRVFHLEIDEESDYSMMFLFQDPLTNLPVDLTGYRAELQVRIGVYSDYAGYNTNTIVMDYNTDTGGVIVGGTSGSVTISIPYKDTYNLTWDKGVYDLFLINPSAKRMKFLSGFLSVIPSATRLSNSQLADISTSGTTSPNNEGLQGQDSITPAIADPIIVTPSVVQPTAIQIIEWEIAQWDY